MRLQGPMPGPTRFAGVPRADVERSRFDRSHAHKTTFDAGLLVPIFVDEVLPGDSFHLGETTFARLATPLKPVMDNLYYESFYFFVPYRLIWDNWAMFCGERREPTDNPDSKTIPQWNVNLSNVASDTMPRYLGIPGQGTGAYSVSALPFRAYNLCINEWFRDQNLQSRVPEYHGDGPDDYSLQAYPFRRGKRHDYFTSCLPWPQKGDNVLIPVGDLSVIPHGSAPYPRFLLEGAGQSPGSGERLAAMATSGAIELDVTNPAQKRALYFDSSGLVARFNSSTGASINALRTAFQIQKLRERDARAGTRYIEIVLAHWQVHSDDLRDVRPRYLGGGSSRISINPVAATTPTADSVAQGDLAGFGTVVNRGRWSQSFTEHGIIIGMANVRADLTYQQGLERFWSRKTRYDFFWPALAHLGEQAVLNKEIYLQGDSVTIPGGGYADDQVFGYQERYAEYRYKPSRISGRFTSTDAAPLDIWHLAQDFANLPVLNDSFIQDNPPVDRIIAVPTEPHILCDIWFDLKCDRAIPVYGVPGLVDHF